MKKCLTAVFLMLAMLLLSGCGRLSAEDYRDELKERWKDYLSAQLDIVHDIQTLDESGTLPPEFEEHCKSFEKAMKSFEMIKPPNGMDYEHSLLLEALENEREWLAAVRALTSANTPEEIEQAEQRIMTAASYENSFPQRYLEVIRALPSDTSYWTY